MKRAASYLILLILFNIIREPELLPDYSLHFSGPASAISTSEDPQARANYEASLLVNPQTGNIPANIRVKELQFSRNVPIRANQTHSNTRNAALTFELAGPFNVGGRTRAAAIDIRNEEVIIAGGVSGGIWKTANGGTLWRRTSDPSLRNSITALAQDTRTGREDTWYFGTGELVGNSARTLVSPYRGEGIYKSTDGGESWSVLSSTINNASPEKFTSQFQYIWNIETNHKNEAQDEVLVAAYGGILRSLDGGDSWDTVLGQKLFDLDTATDLNQSNAPFYTTLRKTPSGLFFAALSSATSSDNQRASSAGIYFSNNGSSWQKITPPGFPEYHERTVLGFSPNETEIYLLTQGGRVTLWKLTIINISNGQVSGTWTDLTENVPALGGQFGDYNSQSGYNMVIEVHPENPNVVFIGGTNLYRSTDGFSSSSNTDWIGGYDPENDGSVYPQHYPDQHLMLFYPSQPEQMISANDGGLRRTNNILADSVMWTNLNNGFLTSQFYTITQRQDEDTNEILGGMQDTGSYLRDAPGENPSWNRVLGGDGGFCAITPNRDFMYVSFQNGQIYRVTLTDDSRLSSFARVDPVGGGEDRPYLFINPFVLDPWNANRMFLTGGDVLWRNENLLQIPGGIQERTKVNWYKISNTRLNGAAYTTIDKALDQDVLYAGVIDERPYLVKVANASDPLSESTSVINSSLFPESGHIICIAIHPENADHFMVIFSNYEVSSIFITENGGKSFEDISGNLEELPDGAGYGPSIRWGEVVPTTNGVSYYVGTSTGLYSTDALNGSNTTWLKESEDMIGSAVITMMDYRPIDGSLVVATHGSGVFRSFLPDARNFANQYTPEPTVRMDQNYPNPFADETTITFNIPENGEVKADLYDRSGRFVRNLLWGPQFKGENRLIWDGTNTSGSQVTPGVYFCVLQYKNTQKTRRIIYSP